mgnify:CR=1 FL=1
MSPRRSPGRGAIVAIFATVIVLAVGGIGLAVWLASRGESPEAGAQRYLEALASGDGDRLGAAVSADVDLGAETVDAFAAASSYLSEPTVTNVKTSSNDTAIVSATYVLSGGTRNATFTMHHEDGRWLADADALGTITATTSVGDAVTIGDVVLEASAPLVALPAAYTVTAAPAGVLAGESEAVVTPGATTEVAVAASLTPDAATRAQPAVDAYLQACAASSPEAPAPVSPPACGISIPWGADLASAQGFVFRVETFPTVTLDESGGFIASGGSYVVTVSGLRRDGTPGSFTYRDDAWTLRGALTFSGGELVLQAW